MPALQATEHFGTITWLGSVRHRRKMEIETEVLADTLELTWDGVAGAAHSGRTRLSDSRVLQQHEGGTEIANVRQITLVGQQDLAFIAKGLQLNTCDPSWLGANLVVDGLPDFTFLPPSSRLQAPSGATLIVDMENRPCHQVGKTIEQDRPGHGIRFKDVAKGRRGITAWVERPGRLHIGDRLQLHIPGQRAWQPGGLGL